MKLSITDKFLWELYHFLSGLDDVVDFTLSTYPKKASILLNGKNPIIDRYRKERSKRQFNNLIYYLKRKNYIRSKNLENKKAIILTKEGLDKALKARFILDEKKKRKDGKWTMLIFDVPEKYRKSRDLLRSILHNLGYKIFQKSVWITPYDVSEKTEKLLQMYSLDNYVKIFLIEEV